MPSPSPKQENMIRGTHFNIQTDRGLAAVLPQDWAGSCIDVNAGSD